MQILQNKQINMQILVSKKDFQVSIRTRKYKNTISFFNTIAAPEVADLCATFAREYVM